MLKIPEPAGLNTHMPFLMQSSSGQQLLFFCCAGEDRIWKACFSYGDGNYERLQTDLPDDVTECCPTAWQDRNGWHVVFIAGGGALGPRYHLFRMDGPALDRLSPPVALAQTKTGFVYKERMAVGELQDLVHVHDHSGDRIIELPGANIYRVSYRADAPHKLLISGKWLKESEVFCLEYDLKIQQQHFIEADGQAAYKCTVYGDQILFADRTGTHFEDRKLCRPKQVKNRRTKIAARRSGQLPSLILRQRCGCAPKTNAEAGPPTRPSCLACVEKHLGAAYVLLTESRDGYAHRLRAIGHLHEAEDESQEYAKLHRAIRRARKDFQKEGKLPDWQSLEALIKNILFGRRCMSWH